MDQSPTSAATIAQEAAVAEAAANAERARYNSDSAYRAEVDARWAAAGRRVPMAHDLWFNANRPAR